MTRGDMHVLIREYSPTNFFYIEMWLALSNLSKNISFGCLIIVVVALTKIFQSNSDILDWVIIATIAFFFSGVLLRRSIRFTKYYAGDLESSVRNLILIEKENLIHELNKENN